MKIDDVIKTFIKLRNKKEKLEREHTAKIKGIKENLNKLQAYIKQKADIDGVTSFKTSEGTASIVTKDFAQVADWDAVLAFIKKEEAWDMLEKRVSKSAVKGYIDNNKDVPNGVNYGTLLDVQVRKPMSKVE